MSGLVNGLQNRLQQFESARHLRGKSRNPDLQRASGFLVFGVLFRKNGGKRKSGKPLYKGLPDFEPLVGFEPADCSLIVDFCIK